MEKQKYLDLTDKFKAEGSFGGLAGLIEELSPKADYAFSHCSASECNQYVDVMNYLADAINPFLVEFRKMSGENTPLMPHLEYVYSQPSSSSNSTKSDVVMTENGPRSREFLDAQKERMDDNYKKYGNIHGPGGGYNPDDE